VTARHRPATPTSGAPWQAPQPLRVSQGMRQGDIAGRAWRAGLVVAATTALLASGSLLGKAQALPGLAHLAVSPSQRLVNGSVVTVRLSGGAYGTTYAIAICGPKVFTLLAHASGPLQDGCDSRHNTLVTLDRAGSARASLSVPAVLTTALGEADCRHLGCFLAAVPLHERGGLQLPVPLLFPLRFAADACEARSCQLPADAWDPSLGPRRPAASSPQVPEAPLVVPLTPVPAGNLTSPDAVTGPYTGQPLAPAPTNTTASTTTTSTTTAPSLQGEGLLRLAMEAPGTSWGPGTPSSTVVDATVKDLTTGEVLSTQQFVLFYGAAPFVYAGFTGPVNGSDHYSLTLSTEPPAREGGLSQPLPGKVPQAVLLASALEVIAPTNPQYLAYSYAPVMYGRSTSALHDVPLLTYADVGSAAGGGHVLSYVVVWSHEDGGTGFYPFLEWGKWGRMTDIENAISFTVSGSGRPFGATYLWGGEPLVGFPDSETALSEEDRPFTGTWWGDHPVLRDATGNNDFSDKGTTPFRFQLAPVAPPAPGQPRDAVMDANPFTYQVMADEIARWYADKSSSPLSPQEGDARQYALVQLDTSGRNVASVAVNLRLAGYNGWFRSDLGWGYPLTGTGLARTVVKLPLGWQGHPIVAAEVAVEPPSAASSVAVHAFNVEAFTGTAVEKVASPAPTVVPESLDVG
jgi:hypothetical protein